MTEQVNGVTEMTALTVAPSYPVTSYDETEKIAKAMAASGFFKDIKSISQAVVKIMAGQEVGIGPFASMAGIHIINGSPSYGANIMAALIKQSGKYDYRIIRHDNEGCELAFYEYGEEVGRSLFTKADAVQAGLIAKDNYQKYPRNLYFARALSNGQSWYCPDVTRGVRMYTPEELGAEVDSEGNVISIVTQNGETIEVPSVTLYTEPEPDQRPEPYPADGIVFTESPEDLIDQFTEPEMEMSRQLAHVIENMTIEQACAIKNSDGIPYGEIKNELLDKMMIGIKKGLAKPDLSNVDKSQYLRKKRAIEVIKAARKDGSIQ